MTKQHPFDDYNQCIHWGETSIGTISPQWSRNAPRNGWKILIEYE